VNRIFLHIHKLLPNMTLSEIDNFSSGSRCLVLASIIYDEKECPRNYSQFKEITSLHGID